MSNAETPARVPVDDLRKMKKADLRVAFASEFGRDADDSWTVEGIVTMIETLRDVRDEGDVEAVDGEVVESASPAAPAYSGDALRSPDVDPDLENPYVPDEFDAEIGQALALREQTVAPQSALPTPAEFNASVAIAEHIAQTSFVPESYRGKPHDVVAAILFGREIGLGPMTSLRDIHMIDGRPALAVHRQLALLRRGGVVILESESTATRAWIRAQRRDTGEIMAVEFTFDEAEKIRRKGKALVDGDNWRNYPADMLWARCVGRLTRRLGSDLLNGLPPYVAEEVADFSGWGVEYGAEGNLGVSEPPPPARQQAAGRTETPKSWAEINAWTEPYGPSLGWKVWIRDAADRLYGTEEFSELTAVQKSTLGQKASGAIVALRAAVDPAAIPPPTRADVQKAWASVLDGDILPGPVWRLSPDEAELGLPTYEEMVGKDERDGEEAATGDVPEPDASPESEAPDDSYPV